MGSGPLLGEKFQEAEMWSVNIPQEELLMQAGPPELVSNGGELPAPARIQQRLLTQVQHPRSDQMTHVTGLPVDPIVHGED